jgi:DNA polymerase III subunit chi
VSEIGFYHLTRTSAEVALPRLLGRTLAAGQRAVVLCGSEARVAALDEALWAAPEPDWLPHGSARTGEADLQPIWLTAVEEAPNGARYLFLIDGQTADAAHFDRVFDLFDGADAAAVQAARHRWVAAKAAGHAITYWLQGERGWEKKA